MFDRAGLAECTVGARADEPAPGWVADSWGRHGMNFDDEPRAIAELGEALASGDPAAVAHAAATNIWPLYTSHFDELIATIETLPAALLDEHPVLRVTHRMTSVLARSARPFIPVVSAERAQAMSAEERDVTAFAQMIAARFSGNVSEALAHARQLTARATELGASGSRPDGSPLWYYHQQIGSTLLAGGDFSAALAHFEEAQRLGRSSPHPDAERMALGRSALAFGARGSIDHAAAALAAATARPAATGAHVVSTMMTERAAAALIETERMTPRAEGSIRELESYDSVEVSWPFALLARTRHLLALQRADEALEAVQLASGAHPHQRGSFASDVIASASIDALRPLGAGAAARTLAETSMEVGPLSRIAIVRYAILESRLAAADSTLRRLAAEPGLGPGPRAETLALSIWLEFARNRVVSAESAAAMLRLARQSQSRRMLATIPMHVLDQVGEALPEADGSLLHAAIADLPRLDSPRRPVLTIRERRVLGAMREQTTVTAIAAALGVSPNTIKSQLRVIYRKLGCRTRDEAIAIASRLHLVASDP